MFLAIFYRIFSVRYDLFVQQIMNFLQMLVIYMGIDLCGGDGSMTEKGLYCSDVGTFSDECGSKTMSQGVWTYFFIDPCQSRIFFYDVFDAVSAEMLANLIFRKRHEKIRAVVCPELKICFQCRDSISGREYRAKL